MGLPAFDRLVVDQEFRQVLTTGIAEGLADFVLVSAVFASNSPSAGRPMGPFRLAAHARRSRTPVYALGGINTKTIKRLNNLGVSGAGAIGALAVNR